MRELKQEELTAVSGGFCRNEYMGIAEPSSFGQDLVKLYEGAVFFTSHVIERVAGAFD